MTPDLAVQLAATLGGCLIGYGLATSRRTSAVAQAWRSEALAQSALREAEALASRERVEAAQALATCRDRLSEADAALGRAEDRHDAAAAAARADLAQCGQSLMAARTERDALQGRVDGLGAALKMMHAQRDEASTALAALQARWDRAFRRERGPDRRIVPASPHSASLGAMDGPAASAQAAGGAVAVQCPEIGGGRYIGLARAGGEMQQGVG